MNLLSSRYSSPCAHHEGGNLSSPDDLSQLPQRYVNSFHCLMAYWDEEPNVTRCQP